MNNSDNNNDNNDKKSFFGYGTYSNTLDLGINGFDIYKNNEYNDIKYSILNLSYEELLNILKSNKSILSKNSHMYKNFTIKDDTFFKYISDTSNTFYDCNFNKLKIYDIDLKAKMFNCNLTDTIFDNSILMYSFLKCNFENSRFNFSSLFCNFTKCNFTNSEFNNCVYHWTSFYDCNLKDSKFCFNKTEKELNHLEFTKCCLENVDMSNNDLSKYIITIEECNTKNAKFNGCVVKKLDSDFTFHVEFLLKGGKIENTKDNYVDKVLTWIGQKIN
jgi:uncharacterized protein YjbI with pentapeptide repeats